MVHELLTIGYEGLSPDVFIARLHAVGVATLVDVRANPLSRKRGFSKKALSSSLESSGIRYIHSVAFGCPKPVRDRYKSDGDWAAYTRGFLKHLDKETASLAELASAARSSRSCLMCFEADFVRCHRTFVARGAAEIGGLSVMHLTGETTIPDALVRSAA